MAEEDEGDSDEDKPAPNDEEASNLPRRIGGSNLDTRTKRPDDDPAMSLDAFLFHYSH
jgi:hypothetical protein